MKPPETLTSVAPEPVLPPALARHALAACDDGIVIADARAPGQPVVYLNEAFCAMTGCRAEAVLGQPCGLAPTGGALPPGLAAILAALPGANGRLTLLRGGRDAPFRRLLSVTALPDEQGQPGHLLGILSDVSELKQQDGPIFSHDALTGLPGRALFHQALEQALRRAATGGHNLLLLCVGIDNFQLVNSSLGHASGEQMLVAIAGRLQQCLGAQVCLARLGASEFLAITDGAQAAGELDSRCEQVFAALAPPLTLSTSQVYASASIGLARYPQDGADGAELMRFADLALAHARAQGGGKHLCFSADMNQHTLERIGLEAALRLAIVREELQVMYLPQASLHDGMVASLTAQLRWQHPQQGLLEARQFMPMAEEAGLSEAIGLWVLQRVCQDLHEWRAGGAATLPVAVPLSPRQCRDRQFSAIVAALLKQYGLAPSMLGFDIGELALQGDNGNSAIVLGQLHALGATLTLDDFGSGHSALSNLQRLPFDSLKIDRHFIDDMLDDAGAAALSKSIISMAHQLGIRVVAKGVATEAQCDFLGRNMCDLIEGPLLSPALPGGGALEAIAPLPPPLRRQRQARQRSLLLVDDEQNIVSALKRLLRRDNYLIHTANSGQEGLDLLAREPVDVIVSDQRMPGMIGADFLRKAKLLYPETIRIMLSGYTELQSVTDAVNEGAIYKFLTKPWDDELLRGHITEAFRLKEIADDNARLNLEVRNANHELAIANRRMEQLLQQNQQQIRRDEISLGIARELLQHLPLPVIGMDDSGMIAFINGAASCLFQRSGGLLGNEAMLVLPELFPPEGDGDGDGAQHHCTEIDGQCYDVVLYPMGEQSASRGSLITLSRCQGRP